MEQQTHNSTREIDRRRSVPAPTAVAEPVYERETALVRIAITDARVAAILKRAFDHGARVLDVNSAEVIVEVTNSPEKIEAFLTLMRPEGILELRRSGSLAMKRHPSPRTAEFTQHYRAQADGVSGEEAA